MDRGSASGWRREALRVLNSRVGRLFLMIVSFAAVPFGLFYYKEQLAATPAWLWPLVPDSPAAAGLYGIAILLHHIGRPSRVLDSVAGALMAKVGAWTVFVLLFHREVYFTPESLLLRIPILITHALMVPMAFIPLASWPRSPRRGPLLGRHAQLLAALLLLDLLDYTIPSHPWVPPEGIEVIGVIAVLFTIVSVAFIHLANTVQGPRRHAGDGPIGPSSHEADPTSSSSRAPPRRV